MLQLFAGFSLWSGNLYGRVMAILFASLSAVAALLSIPAYPFWSLAIFAIDIIIIYQVSLYGGAGVESDEQEPRAHARGAQGRGVLGQRAQSTIDRGYRRRTSRRVARTRLAWAAPRESRSVR